MRVLFLSLFLVAISLTPGRAADVRYVYSPNDGYLNLRTGPGTRFDIIREMYNGDRVRVVEHSGSWVRVVHESGARGWASAKFLVRRGVTRPGGTRYVYSPNDGYLNLRSGPGTRYRVVREMYNGEYVEILERSGNWVRVRHESGATGWASARFLRVPD